LLLVRLRRDLRTFLLPVARSIATSKSFCRGVRVDSITDMQVCVCVCGAGGGGAVTLLAIVRSSHCVRLEVIEAGITVFVETFVFNRGLT
jgi:tRNA A37 threonylcarbamoyladenosine dehydratase